MYLWSKLDRNMSSFRRRYFVSIGLRCKPLFIKTDFPSLQPERLISATAVNQNISTDSYISKLSALLGCSVGTTKLLISRNKKVLTSDLNSVHKAASFCKSNFQLSEIFEFPTVLSLSPYVLNDRASTLRELGCENVTARNILLFNQIMQETSSRLQRYGILVHPQMYLFQLTSQLNCPDDLKLQLISKLVDFHSNKLKLSKIKAELNSTYLIWKLQCSEKVVVDVLCKYPSLRTKSLLNLEKTYDVLLKKFNVPVSKIHSSPKLLALNCDDLEELLTEVPSICGLSIQHIAKEQPTIFKRAVKDVRATAHVLESWGVTAVQLLSCLKILDLSASTVSSKLDSFQNPDIVKNSERFLQLLYHFCNVEKNLTAEGCVNKTCLSDVPCSSKADCAHKLCSSNKRSNLEAICCYLAIILDCDEMNIKTELKQYPCVYLSSAANAQRIVEYLTAQGITREQLRNGLGIVLYDADVVCEYFSNLSQREDLQQPLSEWCKNPNFVQLIIYFIEKDLELTGNGAYVKSAEKESIAHEDELLVNKDFNCDSSESNDFLYSVSEM